MVRSISSAIALGGSPTTRSRTGSFSSRVHLRASLTVSLESRSRELGTRNAVSGKAISSGKNRSWGDRSSFLVSATLTPTKGTPRPYWLWLVANPDTSKSDARINL